MGLTIQSSDSRRERAPAADRVPEPVKAPETEMREAIRINPVRQRSVRAGTSSALALSPGECNFPLPRFVPNTFLLRIRHSSINKVNGRFGSKAEGGKKRLKAKG